MMDNNGLPMNMSNGAGPKQNGMGGLFQNGNQIPPRLSNFFPGGFVNHANDINPQEIPRDGTLCLYPQADYQAIYAKQWTQSGLMSVRYVPENSQGTISGNNGQQEIVNAEILDRLEKIESLISRKSYYGNSRKSNRRNYRQESTNENNQ